MKSAGKENIDESEGDFSRNRKEIRWIKESENSDERLKGPYFPEKLMPKSDHPHREEIIE